MRILLLALLVTISSTVAEAVSCTRSTITGVVTHVFDGDTFALGDMAIRLQGLAAPESGEPGAADATRAMMGLVAGETVRCELDGTHDRCVAVCYLDGLDISAAMVRAGLARDCPRFSGGRYALIEQAAAAMVPRLGRRISCRAIAGRQHLLRSGRQHGP